MGSNETPTRDAAMPADSEIEAAQSIAEVQAVITSVEWKKPVILEYLSSDKVRTIVLKGEAGVGKTWIAKKISALAVREGLSYMDCWVYLNQRDESESLLEKIARQLPVEATEGKDNKKKEEKEEKEEKEKEEQKKKCLESLGRKISAELETKRSAKAKKPSDKRSAEAKKPSGNRSASLAKRPAGPDKEKSQANSSAEPQKPPSNPDKKKFLLLILDGLPDTTNEVDFMKELNYLDKPNNEVQQKPIEGPAYKVLITTRKKDVKVEGANKATPGVIEVKKLESSLSLLNQQVTEEVRKDLEKSAPTFAGKSEVLPAVIVMVAEALNRFGKHDSRTPTWEEALEALEEAAQQEEAAAQREKGPDEVNPLLLSVSNMLQRSDNVALVNCWWHSLHVFKRENRINYDALIICWILEGCISIIGGVEEAYKVGYRVFMELVDRHILKMQGDNIVVMEDSALKVPDYRRNGYGGTSNLGLAHAYDRGEWQVFGGITQAGCMIRTPWDVKPWYKVSTLLTDGTPLPKEVLNLFSYLPKEDPNPLKELKVLVLFNPTMESLPSAFSQMEKLRLLVLRGCDKLKNIDDIRELKSLEVLEISGATSLKKMDDKFFEKLTELRSLHLSGVQIESLPSISQLKKLRLLILRGCSCLTRIPRLSQLKDLEVIDLSGARQLGRFENKALVSLEKLEMLKITKTKLERVPILASLGKLGRLELESCETLPRSSKLGALSNLQILGLSNSGYLEEIPDESTSDKKNLRVLDLSKTAISILPFKFKSFIALEQLDLSDTKIIKLASLYELKNLEVLNLSDCRDLEEIEDRSFEQMTRLRCLNVSRTKIKSLGSFSNLVNLRRLLLKNCSSLKGRQSLESLSKESLSKLEELDLCGVKMQEEEQEKETKAEAGYLEFMTSLRRLDLSDTGLVLPSACKLTNLTELSIRGCSHSKLNKTSEELRIVDPLLGASTKLEILDLSNTRISSLPSLENLRALRELKLRDCLELKQLPVLASPAHLEVLDLFGTGIRQVPPEISKLTSLKHLDLPKFTDPASFDWESIKPIPEELNWVESGIYKFSERRPCMLLSREELSQILESHRELDDECFKNFHFFVCPRKGQRIAGDFYFHRADPTSRRLYFSDTFRFPDEKGRVLEIVGSEILPAHIERAFRKAELISFVDNKLIKSFSDVTASLTERKEAGSTEAGEAGPTERGEGLAMKRCILEMCAEMKTIFGKDETEDAEKKNAGGKEDKLVAEKKTTDGEEPEVIMVENLETLWASNLLKLKWVFHENAQSQSFNKLTELYLDCCPVLEVVFCSSELPPLKTLQIKFCDNLKRLFSEKIRDPKLLELEKLHLLELPQLTSIGVGDSRSVADIFPCVRSFRVSECPKLSLKKIGSTTDLRDLQIDGCPVLEAVFPSSQLPLNLEILEIRSCNELKTLFPPNMEGQLLNFRKLHIEEVTKLTSIGLEDSSSIVDIFPSVKSVRVMGCPKIRSLEKIGSSKNLKELCLDRCRMLEAMFASSQLPESLEILKIRYCNKLKTLFPPNMEGQLQNLQELHLEELTELTSIGPSSIVDRLPSVKSIRVMRCPKIQRLETIGSSEVLKELYLDRCSMLEAVFASSRLPENLEILEIRYCNELKTLFPPNTEVQLQKLQKLQKLHLEELTELTSIGLGDSWSTVDIFPSVKSIRIMGCPKIQNLEKIGSSKDLEELYLDRCWMLEDWFSSSHLPEKLEILEIRFCNKLKTLFPPNMEGQLPKLQKLHLEGLTELTSNGLKDSSSILDIFPSMKSISIMGCPKIASLEKIGSFKNLEELYLDRCCKLEAVFASSQLPESLEILEIRNCNRLKTLFPQNEELQLRKLRKLHLEELPELVDIGVTEAINVEDVFPSRPSIKVKKCPQLRDLERFRQLPNASIENV